MKTKAMTTRRRFLTMLGTVSLSLSGCARITAKRIEDMPREYALLMDADQRQPFHIWYERRRGLGLT